MEKSVKEIIEQGRKFLVNGIEYLRIDGIWFEYSIKSCYHPVDKPDLEKTYKELFDND